MGCCGNNYCEENRCHWDNQCNRCHWDDCCNCHDCRPKHSKKKSAQFVNTGVQDVNIITGVPVNFNLTQVAADKGIRLQAPNDIILERGRYLVAYYVTIQNNDDDADTYNIRLRLNGSDLAYTLAKVRLNPRTALDIDFIGNLGKTNLIEITKASTLQLVINVTDPTGGPDANYQIQDASIVIERID